MLHTLNTTPETTSTEVADMLYNRTYFGTKLTRKEVSNVREYLGDTKATKIKEGAVTDWCRDQLG